MIPCTKLKEDLDIGVGLAFLGITLGVFHKQDLRLGIGGHLYLWPW